MPVFTSSKINIVPYLRVSARTPSRYPGSGLQMPMFSITGSTMKQATSPPFSARSSASRLLNGTTMVSRNTARVMPAVLGMARGESAGPASLTGGFIEIITSSWWP